MIAKQKTLETHSRLILLDYIFATLGFFLLTISYLHPYVSVDCEAMQFIPSTKATGFAVISTHAGLKPLLRAFLTDLTFDHAAQ